tara:strand:- start:345 stop:527 length:183 start_codon:yes stop_codon:yes gene_type:complete
MNKLDLHKGKWKLVESLHPYGGESNYEIVYIPTSLIKSDEDAKWFETKEEGLDYLKRRDI